MSEGLRAKARVDLCTFPDGRPIDPVVWEHSERVAGLTQAIVALPELANHVVDRVALTAAAFYHDAGWILQLVAGEVREIELLLRRTSDRQRDQAADWMVQRLQGILPPGSIQQAVRIVRTCNERTPALLEARILAEAENLDQVGPQTVVLMVRRQMAEGRTLADTVVAWRRQEQYQFWPAWIKECFRLPSVRALAEHRWQVMRRYMADLEQACLLAAPGVLPESPARSLGRSTDRKTSDIDPKLAG